MKKTAITALILAFLMLLTSCAPSADDGDGTDGSDSAPVSDSETKAADNETLEIPKENFEDYEFTILTHVPTGYNYGTLDFDEPTDEPYDNAMYERNLAVEELLGVKISERAVDLFEVYSTFKISTQANTGDFDITFIKVPHACNAVTDGLAASLDYFEYIDLEKVWWNRDATEQLTMFGNSYMSAGDIALSDKECLWTVQFSKPLIADNGLENPYELVMDNEWTWAKMIEMCEVVSYDMNADGVMDGNDMWGLCTEPENYPAMWMSAGLRLAAVNDDGYPEITWGSEQFFNVYQELSEFMVADFVDPDWGYTGFSGSMFEKKQTLFRTTVVAGIKGSRDYEVDFGIVPYPKYDASIDQYYSMIAGNSSIMIIGTDNSDEYRTGIVTEALAAYGHDIIMPVYYEGQLKSKYARDEIMPSMLDIIFTHRAYDLGMFYDVGHLNLPKENVNIASEWASFERVGTKKIEKIIKAVLGE